MNKGPRGGAYGFKLSSLNKLNETRATTTRNVTLLHYIIRLCQQQWPDVIRLEEDVSAVRDAARVK